MPSILFSWLLILSLISFSGIMAGQVVSEMEFKQRLLPQYKPKRKQKPVYFMKKSHYKGN